MATTTTPPDDLLGSFKDLDIFLVDGGGFYYASGGIGPYYIDLRRGPNNPKILQLFVEAYSKGLPCFASGPFAFVGVPTTGVVYATGLALAHGAPLVVMEKSNPERAHLFHGPALEALVRRCGDLMDVSTVAFLGLEDMGVVLATTAGLVYGRPSAIMRRVPKGHGTSKTVEASLEAWAAKGITTLVVMNDPYYPLTQQEVEATLKSIPAFDTFDFHILVTSLALPAIEVPALPPGHHLVEVEDLWTTGTSAIKLNLSIQKVFKQTPSVLVFLDREQGAMAKFDRLGIPAKAIYTIRNVSSDLVERGLIQAGDHSKVMAYVDAFAKPSYMDRLVEVNDSCCCVCGVDITHAKLPDPGDSTMGDYPKTSQGVIRYVSDLMDALATVPEVRVIKPNLAYYNTLIKDKSGGDDDELRGVLDMIYRKAREFGFVVILDTKIGDIARTQAQYAEKYKAFDAVTVHGYMGLDSISPVTDAGLGAYTLVFTSNPSRVDVETLPVLTLDTFREGYLRFESTKHEPGERTFEDLYTCIVDTAPKVYLQMAQRLVDWQFAGSVGGVIGGTRSADGTLKELEEIVGFLGAKLDYLPPLLIPGVGAQGGSATEVIHAIVKATKGLGWEAAKIRHELRKVSINSSSEIDYSPRPADAARELAQEIRNAIDTSLAEI